MENVKALEEEIELVADQTADQLLQLCDRIEELKAKSAVEVVDLQREVLDLQRELLAAKNQQLDDLRATVVESVRKW